MVKHIWSHDYLICSVLFKDNHKLCLMSTWSVPYCMMKATHLATWVSPLLRTAWGTTHTCLPDYLLCSVLLEESHTLSTWVPALLRTAWKRPHTRPHDYLLCSVLLEEGHTLGHPAGVDTNSSTGNAGLFHVHGLRGIVNIGKELHNKEIYRYHASKDKKSRNNKCTDSGHYVS